MISMFWKCHICGDERADEFISVVTTDLSQEHGLTPGTLFQNVRYCNDRPACIQRAQTFRFVLATYNQLKKVDPAEGK